MPVRQYSTADITPVNTIPTAANAMGQLVYNATQRGAEAMGPLVSAGNAINDFNYRVGNWIDSGFDKFVTEKFKDKEKAKKWADRYDGADLALVPDILEDIGIMAATGASAPEVGIALLMGKAGLQNAENFQEAISGIDNESGQELSNKQRAAKGAGAAINTLIYGVPIPAGRIAGALKKAGNKTAAETAEKTSNTIVNKYNELFGREAAEAAERGVAEEAVEQNTKQATKAATQEASNEASRKVTAEQAAATVAASTDAARQRAGQSLANEIAQEAPTQIIQKTPVQIVQRTPTQFERALSTTRANYRRPPYRLEQAPIELIAEEIPWHTRIPPIANNVEMAEAIVHDAAGAAEAVPGIRNAIGNLTLREAENTALESGGRKLLPAAKQNVENAAEEAVENAASREAAQKVASEAADTLTEKDFVEAVVNAFVHRGKMPEEALWDDQALINAITAELNLSPKEMAILEDPEKFGSFVKRLRNHKDFKEHSKRFKDAQKKAKKETPRTKRVIAKLTEDAPLALAYAGVPVMAGTGGLLNAYGENGDNAAQVMLGQNINNSQYSPYRSLAGAALASMFFGPRASKYMGKATSGFSSGTYNALRSITKDNPDIFSKLYTGKQLGKVSGTGVGAIMAPSLISATGTSTSDTKYQPYGYYKKKLSPNGGM